MDEIYASPIQTIHPGLTLEMHSASAHLGTLHGWNQAVLRGGTAESTALLCTEMSFQSEPVPQMYNISSQSCPLQHHETHTGKRRITKRTLRTNYT